MYKTARFKEAPVHRRPVCTQRTPTSTYSSSPRSISTEELTPRSETSPTGTKLSEVLSVLDHEDEKCVFIVRRISKLGYAAHDILNQYFSSNFGHVKNVLLLPSRGKGDSRTRPASMGFIVMANRSDCETICNSAWHRVSLVDVQVQIFAKNERVEVITDGFNITNAYIPKAAVQAEPTNNSGENTAAQTTVTLAQIETLAESILQTLQL
jgi:hypothetical protein